VEDIMKRLLLFLCGILLVCSADLFAQGTQASPSKAPGQHFVADPGATTEKVNVALLPHARRDPEETFQSYVMRLVLRNKRIAPDDTPSSLPVRNWKRRSDPL
jgi:hypothetical protein